MKLLVDEVFPNSIVVQATTDSQIERWKAGKASDEDFLVAAKNGGYAAAVFLGEDVLEIQRITELAEKLEISIVAVAAEDPVSGADYLVRNLHYLRALLEVPAALIVWSSRVDRRPLGRARNYEDRVVSIIRQAGAELQDSTYRTRFDALIRFNGRTFGVATSATSRRTFQALIHQVRYWLASDDSIEGALVVVNAPSESKLLTDLQQKMEERLRGTGRTVSVTGWQPGDGPDALEQHLQRLVS